MRRLLRVAGLSGVVFSVLACSLIVDTSEITEGCGAGMKYCDQKCVGVDEPLYGCSENDCTPRCGNLGNHTKVGCVGSECVSEGCVYGWGCEECSKSLFTDPENCGTCGNNCAAARPPGEQQAVGCRDGECYGVDDAAGGASGTSVDANPGGDG